MKKPVSTVIIVVIIGLAAACSAGQPVQPPDVPDTTPKAAYALDHVVPFRKCPKPIQRQTAEESTQFLCGTSTLPGISGVAIQPVPVPGKIPSDPPAIKLVATGFVPNTPFNYYVEYPGGVPYKFREGQNKVTDGDGQLSSFKTGNGKDLNPPTSLSWIPLYGPGDMPDPITRSGGPYYKIVITGTGREGPIEVAAYFSVRCQERASCPSG